MWVSGWQNALRFGQADGIPPAAHAKLDINVGGVALGRLHRDVEPLCDFLIGEPLAHELQYVVLARRQQLNWSGLAAC